VSRHSHRIRRQADDGRGPGDLDKRIRVQHDANGPRPARRHVQINGIALANMRCAPSIWSGVKGRRRPRRLRRPGRYQRPAPPRREAFERKRRIAVTLPQRRRYRRTALFPADQPGAMHGWTTHAHER
jgi:hypothetical protein